MNHTFTTDLEKNRNGEDFNDVFNYQSGMPEIKQQKNYIAFGLVSLVLCLLYCIVLLYRYLKKLNSDILIHIFYFNIMINLFCYYFLVKIYQYHPKKIPHRILDKYRVINGSQVYNESQV